MPTRSSKNAMLEPLSEEAAAPVRYLARQPIFDMRGRVYAYELLFRSGPETEFRGSSLDATRTMIDNTVVFGVRMLTGGLPAFVNCTTDALEGKLVEALPPGMAVLEILEDVKPTPKVLSACRRFKKGGYRIALDDFTWQPEMEPLIGLADYIKIDFRSTDAEARRQTLARLSNFSGALIAEKVESHQEYEQARREGFTLFQGYFFCKPFLITRRKVPANHVAHMQLLQAMQQQPLDLQRVCELVKRDASLTYRVIRLANSAIMASRQEVTSIKSAIVKIGDDQFRRIAWLAIASEFNAGRPEEILRMAFIRARFCELGSIGTNFEPSQAYLLGLFSMLPAMLQLPMEDAIRELSLSEPLRTALLRDDRPCSSEQCSIQARLAWLKSHERGDWPESDSIAAQHGLDNSRLLADFTEAVVWADRIIAASA
ncbi:EAL and HDOD domain-containing protein [Occallatibacter riparius]|uniref:HDOD domain-containing protein n=1 Tax=Occallatibacter riparius TaxID=1002689 RepID=A0A9J7BWC3_9BACT|nr:HDOD domain-containing protein [Occallatibacter riparius]UWZ86936.1 HDOD domain-containing protein [Occallatibacter riparius]